jgi:TatD DNase family protein
MREERAAEIGGVMHCFTESLEVAQAALDLGFHISFSGIVTFKNAQNLRDVVAAVPIDRLLIETDAPYLAPVPHRGRTNEPAWVPFVAETIGVIKGLAKKDVGVETFEGFRRLFKV